MATSGGESGRESQPKRGGIGGGVTPQTSPEGVANHPGPKLFPTENVKNLKFFKNWLKIRLQRPNSQD